MISVFDLMRFLLQENRLKIGDFFEVD